MCTWYDVRTSGANNGSTERLVDCCITVMMYSDYMSVWGIHPAGGGISVTTCVQIDHWHGDMLWHRWPSMLCPLTSLYSGMWLSWYVFDTLCGCPTCNWCNKRGSLWVAEKDTMMMVVQHDTYLRMLMTATTLEVNTRIIWYARQMWELRGAHHWGYWGMKMLDEHE